MTVFCLILAAIVLVGTGILIDSVFKPSREELEKRQQQYEQILDAIDPQRIEEKRKEKLMTDYEYFLLTGELPPTK